MRNLQPGPANWKARQTLNDHAVRGCLPICISRLVGKQTCANAGDQTLTQACVGQFFGMGRAKRFAGDEPVVVRGKEC